MLFVTMGQALLIIFFFSFLPSADRDSFSKHSAVHKWRACILFFFVHILIQALFQGDLFRMLSSVFSTPLKFLFTTCYYMLFIHLWSAAAFPICTFIALLFEMLDNCIWPLYHLTHEWLSASCAFYHSTTFEHFLLQLIFLLLEGSILYLIRRQFLSLQKIQVRFYHFIVFAAAVLPFFFYRVLTGYFMEEHSQFLQICMTAYSLLLLLLLSISIGRSSRDAEKQSALRMQVALQQQYHQFEKKLQDINTVNQKYHDMKNILLYLGNQSGTFDTQNEIQKLLSQIRPYESAISTGNETLDILLTDKLNLCLQNQINCTPYIDGALFNFLEPLDLCVLFGNALDNAIESCAQIPETADRLIGIKAIKKGETVFLTFRNTCFAPPVFRHGIPITTKADKEAHGYGLQNIRSTAAKYHGTVTCRAENQEFVLSMVFPDSSIPCY